MKPLKDKRLASFFKVDSLNKIVSLIIAIQVAVVLISVFLRLWLGLIVLLLFVIMDVVLWRLSERATEDLNSYISNLSYRIKRGEHEAIIKLPIGIVIYNEEFEIEWLSPYLQSGSKNIEPLIGKKVEDVFDGILKAMKEGKPENKIIKWQDNYYRIRVEEDIHVIYFENVSYYINVREELEKNRSVIGWLFLDNYDELIKGLDDRAVSNFNSLLTTYLSNWARQHNIYYKRIENNKYLLLLR